MLLSVAPASLSATLEMCIGLLDAKPRAPDTVAFTSVFVAKWLITNTCWTQLDGCLSQDLQMSRHILKWWQILTLQERAHEHPEACLRFSKIPFHLCRFPKPALCTLEREANWK